MRKALIILFCLGIYATSYGQSQVDTSMHQAFIATKMAAAAKTGAANDILTNFYQLSLQNLFGGNPELSFSSTIFGLLDSLNNKVEIDTLYRKYRWARNIQINASAKLDSSDRISSVSGGVTISIINKRDVTNKTNAFDNLNSVEDDIANYKTQAKKDIQKQTTAYCIKKGWSEKELGDSIAHKNVIITKSISKFRSSHDTKDLDSDYIASLKQNGSFDVYSKQIAADDSLFKLDVKNIERRPLWTIGGSYSHHPKMNNRDTLSIQTDFVAGFGNITKKLWEVSADAYCKSFVADTSLVQNTFLHADAGLNKVLLEDKDGNSKMELKVFASYDQNLTNGSSGVFAANATYRVCVYKSLWFPITLKYDPKSGNVFGFVTITYNLDKYKTTNL